MPCTLDEMIDDSKCLGLLSPHEKLAARVHYMFERAKGCAELGITTLDELAVSAACLKTDNVTGDSIDAILEYQAAVDSGAVEDGISTDGISTSIACLRNQDPASLLAQERWLKCQLLNCIT